MTPETTAGAASVVAPYSTLMAVLIIICVDIGLLAVVIAIVQKLGHTKGWTLAGALSEDIFRPDPAAPAPKLGAAGVGQPPVSAPTNGDVQYDPSASRLIAFVGMIAILILFVAMGDWVLWQSFTSGKVPDGTSRLLAYLCGGASLFMPYAVNQFRAAFESFGSTGNHN